MRAHVNRGAQPGYPSAASMHWRRQRRQLAGSGCCGATDDFTSTSLAETLPNQMLRAMKATHENLARVQSAFSRSDSLSAVDLDGQRFLHSRLRGLLASGRRDVQPAILPACPLSVITSAVNSCAAHLSPERPWHWRESRVRLSSIAGAFLGLHWCRHFAGAFLGLHWCRHSAGASLGLHWCRHSALCFASSLHKRTDTSRAIHRNTRNAIPTFCKRHGLRV